MNLLVILFGHLRLLFVAWEPKRFFPPGRLRLLRALLRWLLWNFLPRCWAFRWWFLGLSRIVTSKEKGTFQGSFQFSKWHSFQVERSLLVENFMTTSRLKLQEVFKTRHQVSLQVLWAVICILWFRGVWPWVKKGYPKKTVGSKRKDVQKLWFPRVSVLIHGL